MGEYTALTLAAVGLAVFLDLAVVRARVVTTGSFWATMGIMWVFQIFVDGWLTKLPSPIVAYNPARFSGLRVFFDSPIEDFGFAFALVLWALTVWTALGRPRTGP